MNLDDPIWKKVNGGYKIPYDASIALKKLEGANESQVIEEVLDDLWNELHHQGDVDIASYLSVPQLVRIAKEKTLFNWSLIGLCITIEQERHSNNPALPEELTDYYFKGIIDLKNFVIQHINEEMDDTTFQMALAALATCTGRIKLGRFISDADDDVIDEFLEF